MPKIIRVSLTPEQRDELNRRSRERVLTPRLRERLEIIRLSDLGHTVPQIATTLGRHHQTVRAVLKAFLADGFAALPDADRPGRPPTLLPEHLDALERMLDEAATSGQTWSLPLMVDWLKTQFGVTISTERLSVLLKARKFRWKRTQRSVQHKQSDPDLQVAKQADLELLNF
jgi:transposase